MLDLGQAGDSSRRRRTGIAAPCSRMAPCAVGEATAFGQLGNARPIRVFTALPAAVPRLELGGRLPFRWPRATCTPARCWPPVSSSCWGDVSNGKLGYGQGVSNSATWVTTRRRRQWASSRYFDAGSLMSAGSAAADGSLPIHRPHLHRCVVQLLASGKEQWQTQLGHASVVAPTVERERCRAQRPCRACTKAQRPPSGRATAKPLTPSETSPPAGPRPSIWRYRGYPERKRSPTFSRVPVAELPSVIPPPATDFTAA